MQGHAWVFHNGIDDERGPNQLCIAGALTIVTVIAVDLAPRGITVNNIQPGPTRTDMTAGHIDLLTSMIPLKRVGNPDEIAGLVAYLASGESGYMTGSSLTIDGGTLFERLVFNRSAGTDFLEFAPRVTRQ
ncbi:MAG TPA: SDR family oxidoreductase [Acidisoma sp.]|jgi:enoyl-[acyl-carrier-protein] reductase (NADH)|nr:SDR family oxidoreductase [Acidisoma sp.]